MARHEADYYPTPPWVVRRFLEVVDLPGGVWLEPCAGDGAIIRTVNEIRDDVEWIAWELREECRFDLEATGAEVHICDALQECLPQDRPADVIFTNPPFRWAEEMSRLFVDTASEVVMLLRLGFGVCEDRCHFMQSTSPTLYAVPNRIDFTGDGGNDFSSHAWHHWDIFERS